MLVKSEWIEDRILLKNKNIPNQIDIANNINSLQLMDYPIFSDYRSDIISGKSTSDPNLFMTYI